MRADIWLGVVTVIMAVLGGIVSAHAPTKLWHKIAYISAFVVTGAASIWLVIRISNENVAASRELGTALKNLGVSTTSIANMTALNTQLQERLLRQSETIADLSKQNIAAVTGGKTFCYVIATPVGNEFLLQIGTIGTSPLHEVNIELTDVDKMRAVIAGKSTLSFEEIQSYSTIFPTIPFLEPTSGRMLIRIPIGPLLKRNWAFNFFSLNGVWSETLKLNLVNGQWEQAIRVTGKRGTLYTYTTKNFPKKGGKVDWD